MRCHVCNVAVGDGQRFCHECGETLDGVTDPTEKHDVVTDDAVTLDVPAGNDTNDDPDDDAVTVETRGGTDATETADDADDEPLLNSETVTPPTQPEPEPEPTHRGALPDLAAPPMGVDNDASWWAAGGGAPEPDLPSTERIDTIATSTPPLVDDELASTEAMAVTPVPTKTANSLDSIPYEPMDEAPVVDAVPAYEPTMTMPVGAAAAAAGLAVTDEVIGV